MSHATSTPSIRIYDSASLHSHGRYPLPCRPSSYVSAPAIPMPIPNAHEDPPPPLPPPRHLHGLNQGQDLAWQWGNNTSPEGFAKGSFGNVKPGSSLLGASAVGDQVKQDKPGEQGERMRPDRRESSNSSFTSPDDMSAESLNHDDEDREGLSRPFLANHRLQSEKQLGQRSLETSQQAYDKRLLSKIGGPNTPTRTNFLSSSAQEPSRNPHSAFSKLNGQLKPLSMPERLYTSLDSPISRWTPSGAGSPAHSGLRSPIFEQSSSDNFPPRRFGSVSTTAGTEDSSSRQHRGSYEQGMFTEQDFAMDENGIRDLNINDRSPGSEDYQVGSKAGIKRRASSPPSEAAREGRPTTAASGGNDLYHRRSAQMLGNRNSPVSRFQANHGSVSTASSLSQRTGSYASSYGLSVASSATSYSGGEQRLSPGALSPSAETEFGPVSPYAANRSHNPSPRGSLSRAHHQRGLSESEPPHSRKMSAESLVHSRQNSVSKIQGLYICECCPKKPKKFDSAEELRVHELEKQYTCQYCPNRFKNKNEAERHQNSLHLRRHSWSCAALAGVEAAFHSSTVRPTSADVCGYCGDEFLNPANWEARAEHLNHVHKFGECNQAKKFFRADHFRQHLKHSHAGTSGKWTNMLENACMKDEPLPKERMGSVSSLSGSAAGVSGGGNAGPASKPEVIDEVHNES